MSAADLRMAVKVPHGAGTPATTVPSLDWKNSPPELDGGEDAEETFAQSDEGLKEHHRVGGEVVRLKMIEVKKHTEEAARGKVDAAQAMRVEDHLLTFLRRRRNLPR